MNLGYVVKISNGDGDVTMLGEGEKVFVYTNEQAAKDTLEKLKLKHKEYRLWVDPIAIFDVEEDYGD